MVGNESIWKCMKLYDRISDLYDGVRVYMRTYECKWKYMMVYECKWQ